MRGETGSGLQVRQAVHLLALYLRQEAVRVQPLQVRPLHLLALHLREEALRVQPLQVRPVQVRSEALRQKAGLQALRQGKVKAKGNKKSGANRSVRSAFSF